MISINKFLNEELKNPMNSAKKQIVSLIENFREDVNIKIGEKYYNMELVVNNVIDRIKRNKPLKIEEISELSDLLITYCGIAQRPTTKEKLQLYYKTYGIIIMLEYLRNGYVNPELIKSKKISPKKAIYNTCKEMRIDPPNEILNSGYIEKMKKVQDPLNDTIVIYTGNGETEERIIIGQYDHPGKYISINKEYYEGIFKLLMNSINVLLERKSFKNPVESLSYIMDYIGMITNGKSDEEIRIERIFCVDIDKLDLIVGTLKRYFVGDIEDFENIIEFSTLATRLDTKELSIKDYEEYSRVILSEIKRRETIHLDKYPKRMQKEIELVNDIILQRIEDRFGPTYYFVPYWYRFKPARNHLNDILQWLVELEESERVTKEELNELLEKWKIEKDYEEKKKEIVNQKKIVEENITLKMPCTSSIDIDMSQTTWEDVFKIPEKSQGNTQKIDMKRTEVTIETEDVSESETNFSDDFESHIIPLSSSSEQN